MPLSVLPINLVSSEHNPQDDDQRHLGTLLIDASARAVSIDEQEVELSTGEFDLLWLLATKAGKVVNRDSALKTLRGFGYDGLDRSVDIGISRLRRKLGDDANHPYRIKTVRGKGYLFVPDAWG